MQTDSRRLIPPGEWGAGAAESATEWFLWQQHGSQGGGRPAKPQCTAGRRLMGRTTRCGSWLAWTGSCLTLFFARPVLASTYHGQPGVCPARRIRCDCLCNLPCDQSAILPDPALPVCLGCYNRDAASRPGALCVHSRKPRNCTEYTEYSTVIESQASREHRPPHRERQRDSTTNISKSMSPVLGVCQAIAIHRHTSVTEYGGTMLFLCGLSL